MTEATTVKQLSESTRKPVDDLLKQMREAGLPHTRDDDLVSDEQKEQLLSHIRASRPGAQTTKPKNITLERRTRSTLRTGKGRGSEVAVERRKKRTIKRPESTAAKAEQAAPKAKEPAKSKPSQLEAEAERIRADEQKRKEAEQRARDEENRRRAEVEEAQRLKEQAEAEKKAEAERKVLAEKEAEQQAKEQAEAEKKAAAEKEAEAEQQAEAKKRSKAKKQPAAEAAPEEVQPSVEEEADEAAAKAQAEVRAQESGNRRAQAKGPAKSRERTRDEDEFGDGRSRRRELSLKNDHRRPRRRSRQLTVEKQGGEFERPQEVIVREVAVGEVTTVGELAQAMSVKAGEVIKTLMSMGVMATINQTLDQDTAILVVEEMGHKAKAVAEERIEEVIEELLQVEGEAQPRSPVVTVMGHVDHGKTSLLDHIRKTRVVAGEAGGITQHIGAYHVETEHGDITFIDTPGHAAFTAMRARGAKSTDVVILVVAADDGVMPQTEEAVNHARAAEVPLVVAINKMDLEGADPERAKNELSALGVIPEDWGGDTQFVPVSAETGDGIDDLLEALTLQASVLELTAVPEAPGRGVVIESRLDRGKGSVATLLVQNGTLNKGDIVIAGECFGRVRAMTNERGDMIEAAGPSIPVEVLGLNGTPGAGDEFSVMPDERKARELSEFRANRSQEQRLANQKAASLENMFANLGKGEKRVLKLVLKADVRGSLEAIVQACGDIGNDEVAVSVLGAGVGGITESDANMALTYGAVIFGFNTRADVAAKAIIEREGIDLRYYSVIYELLDDIKLILQGMLDPELREEIIGTAEVRDVFRSPRYGQVAGCMVVEGSVLRNKKIRVLRDNVVIFEGELESLRRFKDDVMEVRNGLECGIGVRNYNDVRAGDKIEVFESKQVAREL